MRFLIIALTSVALLCGCAMTPRFAETPLDSIQPGVTTQQEVRRLLGPPDGQMSGDSDEGGHVWVYEETKTSKLGSSRRVMAYTGTLEAPESRIERTLTIHLDEEGVVQDWDLEQRRIRPGHR